MADPLWTSAEIIAATGGAGQAPFAAYGVSIDTRTLEPGDLFVALPGERDGHDFIAEAMAKGATGALVSRPTPGAVVQVTDTLKALEAMAVAARERAPAAKRAAVTGSVGKTTATQAIAAGLARAGKAHASVKSYNNHIGVPLTLARMPQQTARAVFEVGMNHADEIRPLTGLVRPHVALVTTVGPVHIENFPDGETGVARAKAEIFEGLEPSGIAVLNADNVWFDVLRGAALEAGARIRTFGTAASCDARLVDFAVDGPRASVRAKLDGEPVAFQLAQTGDHWGLTSLAILLTLDAMGVSRAQGLETLSQFEPLSGRGAQSTVQLRDGAFTLINDSYNANPMSMASGIATLGAHVAPGRRIAALTDMLELGPDAPALHAALAAQIQSASIDLVFCAGPLMKSLWDSLPPTRRGGYAETAADLVPQLAQAMQAGDVVMVKGSKGSDAARIALALAQLGLGGAT